MPPLVQKVNKSGPSVKTHFGRPKRGSMSGSFDAGEYGPSSRVKEIDHSFGSQVGILVGLKQKKTGLTPRGTSVRAARETPSFQFFPEPPPVHNHNHKHVVLTK